MQRSTQAALATLAFLASCGGSSDSTPISGLAPPSSISVVEPIDDPSPLPQTSGLLPPNSAYVTDEQNKYVYDPSLEPLQTINMILCVTGRLGARQLVNEGPYIAQINLAKCENGGGDTSAAPSSSGLTESFELWTVDSERATKASDHITQIWIPNSESSFDDTSMMVEMAITRGAGDGSPLGQWILSYVALGPSDLISAPPLFGSLATVSSIPGLIGFQFFEVLEDIDVVPAPNERASNLRVSVAMQDDLTTGVARIRNQTRTNYGSDSGIVDQEFRVAFDDTHFLRETVVGGLGDGGVVFHRDQFSENVWRYGMYHATGPNAGQRVRISSGFGIEDPSGNYGYIGYYGLWGQDGADFSHGTLVTRETYGNSTPTSYTMFEAPGKLRKYSRQELDLLDAGGHTFEWPSYDSMTSQPTLYLVKYDTMTSQWLKIGERLYSESTFTTIDPAEVINTAAEGYLGLWSDSLGGSASYVHGDTSIAYFLGETVIGTEEFFGMNTEIELFGFVQCLDTGILGTEADTGDIYLPDAPDAMTPYRFEFDRADMTLRYDSDGFGTMVEVGLADGETISGGPNSWGLQSGPMVASTSGFSTIYDAWNATEFYVYETGTNDWNKYFGVKTLSGDFVEFEPPINITYTHTTANDRNDDATYNGQTYVLNYGGFGNLGGLPYEGVDLDGDTNDDRFYPVFALEDGVLLGSTGEYIVKAIDIEQALIEDSAYAGTLNLTGVDSMVLPNPATYVAPTNGTQPVVTGPPRVIDGDVQ